MSNKDIRLPNARDYYLHSMQESLTDIKQQILKALGSASRRYPVPCSVSRELHSEEVEALKVWAACDGWNLSFKTETRGGEEHRSYDYIVSLSVKK